ncbi:MAG: AzlC family ABC transporter permease [Oscillospiraceae bacterium]
MKQESVRTRFFYGARAGLPVVLGYIPVGIAFGVMARQAGFSTLEAAMMSLTVYAGASEMMSVGMYAQGAGILAIVLTTFFLNLRHIIMSTCVFSRMRSSKLGQRLLMAFGVTDEAFAIYTTVPEKQCTPAFFAGLVLVTYSSWVTGTVIGAVASDFLPAIVTASLGIALYAMFIGLLMPGLRGNFRLMVLVLFTAVVNSLLSLCISSSWALIISTLAGAFAGVFFVDLDSGKEDGNEH